MFQQTNQNARTKISVQKMSLRSFFCLLLLTVSILATPEGYYHQQYQYKQSASSYKNNELQHKKDDEGFYTKDGDLTGSQDPKVNEQHEHREFINPKLRAQGYTEQDFAGSGLNLQQRAQQLLGSSQDQFGTAGGYNSAYQQNALHSGTTLSSGMQSFMANLQYDMQRQLERQLQQWRQDQDEYSGSSRNRYSTSSGLYSPSTTSVDSFRRELQEEIRTNLTREIDLRNRVAQTHYDSTDLDDIKDRLQENLMRQLNVLMREQQARLGTQPTNIIGGSTNKRQSSSSSALRTKSASTQTNYNTPTSIPYSGNNRRYSSLEQDDLNNRQYYQQQPEQYQYSPSSGVSKSASRHGGTTDGTYAYGIPAAPTYAIPAAPIIRNVNQITDIAQQVQNDMQQILVKALNQYQTENTFNPTNKFHTKPDYHFARQDFESRLNFNLTELFQTTLERNFGQQDLRDRYYFTRNQPQTQQRYANYKQEDYERLKQQVTENLQKFLRDSLTTQEEYYESQQRAYASSSSSSYTAGQVRSTPYQEDHYPARPYSSSSGQGGSSNSYSSSSSYSGTAAYQSQTRPQQTYYPGYRATSDTTIYGTFANYQRDGPHIAGQAGAPEDCDEGMQGDDPSAYNAQPRFYPQRTITYSQALRQPVLTSEENYQRPMSDPEDDPSAYNARPQFYPQRTITYSQALRQPMLTSEEDYQRPMSDPEDYQRPVSHQNEFGRPTSNMRTYQSNLGYQRPTYNNFYDAEKSIYDGRSRQSTTPKNVDQFAVDSSDYDDDIKLNQKILNIGDVDDSNNINIEVEETSKKSVVNSNALYTSRDRNQLLVKPLETHSWIFRPSTERIESSSYEKLGKAQIDEIAQKLKDSVEEFHGNMQQMTLDEDDLNLEDPSTSSTQATNFNDFSGTTQKSLLNQNSDLLRVVQPQPYYRPYSANIFSSTAKYDTTESNVQKPTPKYAYLNRQPFYGGNSRYYYTSTSEAPKMVAHNFDMQQHHVEDSYEDFQVHENPLYAAPKLESNNYELGYPYRPAASGTTQQVPKKPTRYPEDDQFLENALRQPKAINFDDDAENDEDFAQKPVDDNQEVIISSHRGDIDSFAKPNVDRKPVELSRDLPIRLADISRPDFQHSDDLQRPLEDSFESQEHAQLQPIRLIDISRPQNVHGPSYNRNNGFDLDSDDLQRPLEDLNDVQEDFHYVQRPLEDLDDGQRPAQRNYDDNYDQQVNQFQGQGSRRFSETYQRLTTTPKVAVAGDMVQKLQVKPIYLSSDYNLHEDEQNFVDSFNLTETQNEAGFWKQFGSKISKTYNSTKQKVREIAEKINLL